MRKWIATFSVLMFLLAVVVSCVSGCVSAGSRSRSAQLTVRKVLGYPDDPYLAPIPAAPPAYKEAYALFEARDYQKSAQAFERFLREQPLTNWTHAAQFNWGRSLEEQGRYREALAKYQDVIEKGALTPKLQGLALLRASAVFEAMGEDDRSLASLKDAERRAASLPEEVARVELPARLAAAYARERNEREAERYFLMADKGLAKLRVLAAQGATSGELPEWLPRVLYAMGQRPQVEIQWDRFEANIVPLERSQGYLLQSAELGVEPWASKAADELIGTYRALRVSIDSVPTPAAAEIIVAAREQQRERWTRLVRLSDALVKLSSLFVTEIEAELPEGAPARRISDFVGELDEGLQSTLMLERPVGEKETDESRARREHVKGRTLKAEPAFPGEGSEEAGTEE